MPHYPRYAEDGNLYRIKAVMDVYTCLECSKKNGKKVTFDDRGRLMVEIMNKCSSEHGCRCLTEKD